MSLFQWNEKHSSAFRRTRFAEPPKGALTIATELLEQTVKLAEKLKDSKERGADDETPEPKVAVAPPTNEDRLAKDGTGKCVH